MMYKKLLLDFIWLYKNYVLILQNEEVPFRNVILKLENFQKVDNWTLCVII